MLAKGKASVARLAVLGSGQMRAGNRIAYRSIPVAWVLFCKAIWRIYSNRVGESDGHVRVKSSARAVLL
jgi:hypothetical protein